jgi:hypothetical protein
MKAMMKSEFVKSNDNKQNNFAVELISINYSIMYLSFLFLNLSTNVSRSLSNSLSFPGSASIFGMMREERSLKFKFES